MSAETNTCAEQPLAWPRRPELLKIARRVCWWQAPDETLASPILFLAQVMTTGTWSDVCAIRSEVGDRWLRETLTHPPAGLFDAASWHYWHRVLGIEPIPPLPRPRFP